MIQCFINGHVAYPAAQSDIKIVLQNPYIKDGDEKTMEVVFPMTIAENREVFGALNRIDTHFEMSDYESCRLLADGIEIIQGKGTVTSVTDTEVKLQILCGKSYLRYKASFDNMYIDEIDYGQVSERYQALYTGRSSDIQNLNFTSDLNGQGFIGEAGKYVFCQVHDETSDIWVNQLCILKDEDYRDLGITLCHAAVQPSLMMVLEGVMRYLGYEVSHNEFDTQPWNRLYVCSARKSLSIARALPHWSCYKFLDEFRKLFNAVFAFDEVNKRVSILPFGESGGAGREYIEPLEEFSSGYDEEGLVYLGASNLEYELSGSDRFADSVQEDVQKAFAIQEYTSYEVMQRAFDRMTKKEKLTTLMKTPAGWYYAHTVRNDDDQIVRIELKECGWFSPLIRKDGASKVTLSMVPVAMNWDKAHFITARAGNGVNGAFMIAHKEFEFDCLIPNIECDSQTESSFWHSVSDETVEYVTVEDVLENGEATPEEGSDDSLMQLFFASGVKLKTVSWELYAQFSEREWGVADPDSVWQPVPFTECRHTDKVLLPLWSMSLFPASGYSRIGNFHNNGIRIRRNVNGNNEISVPFLFDGKPDPRKIYVIRNRKFVCSHIEMAVGENGIDRVKTGYFYEML